ncbi:MAG: ATP-binding protein [Candidatus Micrarchaeota archaeon]|nr:ATP-binding protein [Candidatus Micrarchaeota archaeon]
MSRLEEWNPWWEGKSTLPSDFIPRQIEIPSFNHTLSLTGVKYGGKTTFIHYFIQQHYPEALYIPLSDPYFNPTSLSQYVEYYLKEINPSQPIIILDDVEHPIEPIPDIKMILISSYNHPTSLSLYPLRLSEMLQVKDPQTALKHYLTYGGFPAVYLSQNKLPPLPIIIIPL